MRTDKSLAYIAASICAALFLFPLLWMFSTSLKEAPSLFAWPPEFLPGKATLANYRDALSSLPFPRFLGNTVFVAVLVVFGQVLCSILAGYAFSKLRFRYRDALFVAYLSSMMIPEIVTIIPNFVLMKYFGWIDTYRALIVPSFFGTAFGMFLLRQFFTSVPDEMIEAAKMDGARTGTIIFRLVVPVSKAAIVSLSIYSLVEIWNDFMWPLTVINSTAKKTLAIGLMSLQGLVISNWAVLMAGAVLTMVPLVAFFLSAQKYFIEGITLTGIK